jgi:hypothetical protein
MRVRKKDRRVYPKRGVRVPYDSADPFNDGDDRESMLGHAYTFGACLAQPGGDQFHGPGLCDLCDWVRAHSDDPEFLESFEQGKLEQGQWVRMYRHRRVYGQRRRGRW